MSEPSKKIKGDYRNNAILNFISRAFIINLFLKRISPTVIFIVLIINYWVRAGRKNISTRSSLRGSQSSLSYALISIWPIMIINWASRLNARLVRNWFRNFSVSCVKKWTFLVINPITQRALRDPYRMFVHLRRVCFKIDFFLINATHSFLEV